MVEKNLCTPSYSISRERSIHHRKNHEGGGCVKNSVLQHNFTGERATQYNRRLMADHKLILITGATGYIGGQLAPRLLERGYTVRVLVRNPDKLAPVPWSADVDVAVGDVLDPTTLHSALSGVDAAYYFVHSMTSGAGFAEKDCTAARNFGEAAKKAGVKRVLYLGGLGVEGPDLSEHLRSRHQTGEALRRTGIPLTEFRAAVIVGTGSISFEMMRYLTERLPVMICPRWTATKTQPIAIEDVLSYLADALDAPASTNEIIEIGGSDVLTYGGMMRGYARVRGLRRHMFHVPVLTPRLSSYWVHLVTPIPSAYATPLIEGLRSEVIVTDNKARRLFPHIQPCSYEEAVRRALAALHPGYFSDLPSPSDDDRSYSCSKTVRSGMIVEVRRHLVSASLHAVFATLSGFGEPGSYPYGFIWRLRALMDRMAGGPGLCYKRQEPGAVTEGDLLGFFRVEQVVSGRSIRLKASVKLPGEGWLEFRAEPVDERRTSLVQRVFFAPKGLTGVLYWYAMCPGHGPIFRKMVKRLARKAEKESKAAGFPPAE